MIVLHHVNHLFGAKPQQGLIAARQRAGKDRIRDVLATTLALDDVSLTVAAGELFVVMGPSGSGKSTLVRLINGLIVPQAGSVTVAGREIGTMTHRALTAFRRARTAMVFQSFALFPHRTVAENAAFGLKVAGIGRAERDRRAKHWLTRVGLAGYEEAFPHELSGGMRQRAGLARALAVEAPILLMDEPFSALDPVTRSGLQSLLLEVQRELARTIVFVTHDFAEAARLAGRMAVLDHGQIAQIGAPAQIIAHPATPAVARFVAPVAAQGPAGN